jgi:hypothetical protein
MKDWIMQTLRKYEQPFLKTAAGLGCLMLLIMAACVRLPASPIPSRVLPTVSPTRSSTPSHTPTPDSSPISTNIKAGEGAPTTSLTPTELPPDFWKQLPIIPTQLSPRVHEIYTGGLALGNNPRVFSRIGDCASAAPAFLVGFDRNYNLGDFASLQPAIDYFRGSFERSSLAAKAGLNSAGLLTTLWTGEQCQKDESLLDCQYRLDRPSFALISIGTNEAYYVHVNPGSFEHNLRLILDDTIGKGIVPVLATKADNVEGDDSINGTIARLAMEYQLPLWNFWRAAQPLPAHGMVDPEHLSSVSYANFTDFTIPNSLQYGVQIHNLTALQILDYLRQQLAGASSVERTPINRLTP